MTDKVTKQAIEDIEAAIRRLASAITPVAVPGTDAGGGTVESLTEAVMGVTAGLFAIAGAIESVAEVLRDRDEARE